LPVLAIIREHKGENIMKKNLSAILMIATLLVSGCAAYAQGDVNQDSQVYQVETRLDDYMRPATFIPTKATAVNGAVSENVVTSTQRILNKEAPFLKKGLVKPVG
jgi:PBP1b-binding outer membrane lipoprotein LpoB